LKGVIFKISSEMVELTELPRAMAPENSKTAAIYDIFKFLVSKDQK
jgi:hypothetical protein